MQISTAWKILAGIYGTDNALGKHFFMSPVGKE